MLWRIIKGKNRRGWRQKLFGLIDSASNQENLPGAAAQRRIWIHAVSVGEVNLLAPILNQIHETEPELLVAISTTTEAGFDLAQKKYPDHYVFFCPFDFTWAIKRVIRRLRPEALVLAELELWPNLITVTSDSGIPVVVMNARLSKKSSDGYQRFKFLMAPILKKLTLVLCQTETYASRFRALGCCESRVQVTGNVKFDGISTNRKNPLTRKLVELWQIKPGEQIFLAGSTQVEEDLMAVQVYQRLRNDFSSLQLILIPRHPERVGSLTRQLEKRGIEFYLRSKITDSTPFVASNPNSKPILIVDVIGELGAWWGCADIAYVGGSMGSRGGQNMIEPAGYGAPVCFGPHTQNFRETVDQLKSANAATVVHGPRELEKFARWVLEEESASKAMGQRAQRLILDHAGASKRTAAAFSRLIQETPAKTDRTPQAA